MKKQAFVAEPCVTFTHQELLDLLFKVRDSIDEIVKERDYYFIVDDVTEEDKAILKKGIKIGAEAIIYELELELKAKLDEKLRKSILNVIEVIEAITPQVKTTLDRVPEETITQIDKTLDQCIGLQDKLDNTVKDLKQVLQGFKDNNKDALDEIQKLTKY